MLMSWTAQFEYWHWLIISLLLLGIELLIPGAFFIWIGIAAAITAAVTFIFDITLTNQLLLFSIASIFAMIIGKKVYGLSNVKKVNNFLNRRADQLIGRKVILLEPIVKGEGTVNINDAIWKIKGTDAPAGTIVQVVSIEGNVLWVREVKQ